MDTFYNTTEARTLLEHIALNRVTVGPKNVQLVFFEEDGGAGETATPIPINRPRSWKLTATSGETTEELVLRIQGIICQQDLPPVTRPVKIEGQERRYIKQGISLTAFGAPYFEACVKNILEINHLFSRALPTGKLDDWTPSTFNAVASIDMGNRYFINRHDSTGETIPFKPCVDPHKYLERALGSDYMHTRENEVKYFESYIAESGTQQYRTIEPIKLRIGDIVEAQISFVAVPIKDKRFKLIIVLRAVTLLDMKPSRDAINARSQSQSQALTPRATLKRKVGYSDDDEGEIREKTTRMSVL